MVKLNNANTHHLDAESPLALKKASTASRLGAFIIDHVIITFILVAPSIFIIFGGMNSEPYGLFVIVFPSIMIVAFFAYCLKDTVNGQSIGKRALGIAVRDRADTLQVPSVGRLFLRNILVFLWPIEFLVYVFSAEQTKIGDKLAGTDVYCISYKPKLLPIIITGVLVFVMFIGALVFGVMAIFRNHSSYQAAIQFIKTNPRVAELVGDIEGFGAFPSGSINTSGGRGQAEFIIRVVGSEGTIRVHIQLVREPLRDWEVIEFFYSQ